MNKEFDELNERIGNLIEEAADKNKEDCYLYISSSGKEFQLSIGSTGAGLYNLIRNLLVSYPDKGQFVIEAVLAHIEEFTPPIVSQIAPAGGMVN